MVFLLIPRERETSPEVIIIKAFVKQPMHSNIRSSVALSRKSSGEIGLLVVC